MSKPRAPWTTPEGRDLHKQKAAEMFGVSYDAVTPLQRQAGKRANYVRLYSCSNKEELESFYGGVLPVKKKTA